MRFGRLRWKKQSNFDSWRSRWQCRSCRRVFAVGLALWPVRRAGNYRRDQRPVDTIPTKDNLRGLLQRYSRGWNEPVNLACACVGEDATDCLLHGG